MSNKFKKLISTILLLLLCRTYKGAIPSSVAKAQFSIHVLQRQMANFDSGLEVINETTNLVTLLVFDQVIIFSMLLTMLFVLFLLLL